MQPVAPHLTLPTAGLQVDALPCDTLKRVRDVYRQMQALYQAAASDTGKVGHAPCLFTSRPLVVLLSRILQSSHLLLLLNEARAWWRAKQPMLASTTTCSVWPLASTIYNIILH